MVDKNLDLRNSHTFTIDLKLPSGEFSGKFTVHRPTMGEKLRIGNISARELEGNTNADGMTTGIAYMIATFDVVIDSAPTWFKSRELRDLEVLQAVWDEYSNYLSTFQRKTEPEEPSQGTAE